MTYAIDLSRRQSARTLEQAVRHQAVIVLTPRLLSNNEKITCRLVGIETPTSANTRKRCLALVPYAQGESANEPEVVNPDQISRINLGAGSPLDYPEAQIESFISMIGLYCDVTFYLGEHRYLFSSDVVGVIPPSINEGRIKIYLTRPSSLQVAQRRRFRRVQLAQSSIVKMNWTNDDKSAGEGIGWLCNVSGDGLANRTEPKIADQLWIGQELKVEFSLIPGSGQKYVLDAVLCNKTPAGTQGKIILGLQFLAGPGYELSNKSAEALRQQLTSWYASAPDPREGADA